MRLLSARRRTGTFGAPFGSQFLEPPSLLSHQLRFGPEEIALPSLVAGDFEVGVQLGSGSSGVVHVAWQRSLRREVALKLIRVGSSPNARANQLLLREARAAAGLNHESIVKVFAAGQDGEYLFIAMELVNGLTLRAWNQQHERSWLERLQVFDQVLAALDLAHQAGQVHRDLKPENILIRKDGRPVVVDFGLSKGVDDSFQTQGKFLAGTPSYMAPEAFNLDAPQALDHRADVYSLGVCLFETLVEEPAYRSRDLRSLAVEIQDCDPCERSVRFELIPEPLQKLLRHALRKDPRHRFQTMAEFRAVLRQSLKEVVAGAERWDRLKSFVRSTSKWFLRGAAVMLVATSLLVAVLDHDARRVIRIGEGSGGRAWFQAVNARGLLEPAVEVQVTRFGAVLAPAMPGRLTVDRGGARLELDHRAEWEVALPQPSYMLRPAPAQRANSEAVRLGDDFVAPFLVSRRCVSQLEYLAFLAESANRFGSDELQDLWPVGGFNWSGPTSAIQPVTGVVHSAARAFAEWRGGRLPSAEEYSLALSSLPLTAPDSAWIDDWSEHQVLWASRWDSIRDARRGSIEAKKGIRALRAFLPSEGESPFVYSGLREWTCSLDPRTGDRVLQCTAWHEFAANHITENSVLHPLSSGEYESSSTDIGFRCAWTVQLPDSSTTP